MEELCSNCNVIYCANTNENSKTSLHPSLSGIAWQTYTRWAENTLCLLSLSLSDVMLGRQFSSTISTAVIWLLQTPHFIIQTFYSTSTLPLYSLLVKPAPSLPRLFDQSCVNHQKPSAAPAASSTFAKMVCCKEDLVKIVYNYGAARRFGLRQSL